jgi:hypothetical protein
MPRSIIRTATTAIAIVALAAPTALARPTDTPPAVAKATAAAKHKQDARSPDATDAATRPMVDRPSNSAADSATRPPLAGPPTWPVNPQPIAPAHGAKVVDDGGVDWAPIALGIVGGLLAVGAVAVLTTRRRRMRVRLAS